MERGGHVPVAAENGGRHLRRLPGKVVTPQAPVPAAPDGGGQVIRGRDLHQDEQPVGRVREEDPGQAQ